MNRKLAALLSLCGLSAAILIYWATPYGPGVSPDSTIYIGTARSLLEGRGFESCGAPMTHYPPVYPILLAAAGTLGRDLLQSSRALHAILFGLNVVLVGCIAAVVTAGAIPVVICSLLLFVPSFTMLDVHAMSWSEPPFITFSLAAFLLLLRYLSRKRFWLLLASAACLGLAMGTRYVGITLLPPMLACILRMPSRTAPQRIRDGVVLTALGCAPLAAWLLRNTLVTTTMTDRTLTFHPARWGHVTQLLNNLHYLWLPVDMRGEWRMPQTILVCALLVAALVILRRDREAKEAPPPGKSGFPRFVLGYCAVYLAFIFFTVSFVDALTPLDGRILAPLFPFLVVLAPTLAWNVARALQNRAIWIAFLISTLFVACINGDRGYAAMVRTHVEGGEFVSRDWRNSETIAVVRALPPGTRIYSNGPDVIEFLTGRRAQPAPPLIFPETGKRNMQFAPEMQALTQEVGCGAAVVVHFKSMAFRRWFPTRKQWEEGFGLSVVRSTADGMVIGRPEPAVPETSRTPR
jgi:4-amino-4-deoxy-L-arabinose transferase-like glycosyltransferase